MEWKQRSYNLVEDRGDSDGPEAADVWVGDEGSDEGRQAGSSIEVGDGIGSFG